MTSVHALRLAAVTLIAGLCFLMTAAHVRACSCGALPSPVEALAQSAKVFSGKVVHVSGGGGAQREPALLSGYILVEFEVYSVWKGPAFATMFVETAWWSGSCGVEFYVGQEWLVYSYDGETAHPCGRTRRLEMAHADVDALGEGRAPAVGTVEPYRQAGARIERARPQAAATAAPLDAARPLRDAIPSWLGLAFLIVVAIAVLGWVLRGTTRRG